jgi:hypothetical protein
VAVGDVDVEAVGDLRDAVDVGSDVEQVGGPEGDVGLHGTSLRNEEVIGA